MNPKWRNYAIGGIMVAFRYGLPALKRWWSNDTIRMCPKCAQSEVRQVGRSREKKDGERLAYSLCFACDERYRHFGKGAFQRVSDEEWKRFVPRNAKQF